MSNIQSFDELNTINRYEDVKIINDLATSYDDFNNEIIDLMSNNSNSNSKAFLALAGLLMLKRYLTNKVNKEVSNLNKFTDKWVIDNIPRYYKTGANTEIPNYIYKKTIDKLIDDTSKLFSDANNFVSKSLNDVIKKIIDEGIKNGNNIKEISEMLSKKIAEEGINGIIDKLGRNVNINAYANMVARTATTIAHNTGVIDGALSNGDDLVKMSSHATSCGVCAVYQGRIYSITGKDTRFPKIDFAFNGNQVTIHPNCRHFLIPVNENDITDNMINYSNRSFKLDPRTQRQIERYNRQQKNNQIIRQDKKLFDKYRLLLPNDTPKSFIEFRKLKKDDLKWNELKNKLKNQRNNNDT